MSEFWEIMSHLNERQTRRARLHYWIARNFPHGIRHTILRPAFWLGLTLGFPLEHLLWEKAPVFSAITRWLGL
jgi:hypothetical protein